MKITSVTDWLCCSAVNNDLCAMAGLRCHMPVTAPHHNARCSRHPMMLLNIIIIPSLHVPIPSPVGSEGPLVSAVSLCAPQMYLWLAILLWDHPGSRIYLLCHCSSPLSASQLCCCCVATFMFCSSVSFSCTHSLNLCCTSPQCLRRENIAKYQRGNS